ncbi:hypothetical protein B0H17DRAFT_938238 [Mycena rosella]|uniref:Zn(2)-C6 fungal-type domain-containing protein n=1 Tax=Mycena rosella TaxID=1033263 RepID=A0AAD7DCR1_MYCRO|nr:hypothetical protein B0H17DRAFT_938238 [Mycena rosella]
MRRRLQGACDACKKRKGESSDSSEMPGNRCTNCIKTQIQCTHARPRVCPRESRRKLNSPAAYSSQRRILHRQNLLP